MFQKKFNILVACLMIFFLVFTGFSPGNATAAGETTRTTEVKTLQSTALTNDQTSGNNELTYKVYKPKGYDENRAEGYPVLYLLHGSGGHENSWDSFWSTLDDMIEKGDLPPVLAVAPSSGNSYWVDSIRFGAYESAVVQDLIPEIDKEYNTISSRDGRYIMGYSMGGYGALRYSLVYPELFKATTLLSPAIQNAEAPATSGAVERGSFATYNNNNELVYDPSVWTAKNYPTAIESYVEQEYRLPIYIFAGDDDWNHLSEKEDLPDDAYKYNMEVQAVTLYQELHRKNIFDLNYSKWDDVPGNPAELRIVNGGHSTSIWLIGFREGLNYMFGNEEGSGLSPKYNAANYNPTENGTIATHSLALDSLVKDSTPGDTLSYVSYLPYGYDENDATHYPVMYLLHGSWGSTDSWNSFWPILDTMIEEGKIPPVIAIAPITGNSYWVDSEKFGHFESAIIQDLIPYVDTNYKTIASREGRGIVGYSMGGYGALRYSLSYPEKFGGATLLSPAIQDAEAPATSGAVERGSFGDPFDAKRWDELNYPAALDAYRKQNNVVPMYVITGDDDWNHLSEKEDLPSNAYKYNMEVQAVNLYQQIHRINLFNLPFEKWDDVPASPAELRIINGGHDMEVWATGFEEGLPYMFANGLSGIVEGGDPSLKQFTISNGTLSKVGGISATVTVAPTVGATTHAGNEVVVFQLMKGNTPESIVTISQNIDESKTITAHFNVAGSQYSVRVFVVDQYDHSFTSIGTPLANSLILQ